MGLQPLVPYDWLDVEGEVFVIGSDAEHPTVIPMGLPLSPTTPHEPMIRANVTKHYEQTMAHFLNGLNHPIKKITDFQPYSNLIELVH